ncbi:WD40-like Beta Propeller Repeat [Flaviramulus basaltis]|uniref:WD40-like Beta Propeller Repeat n=1 Tax=Flaviramulus basaltis TaxID=369401 RepID=A0A1K2IGS5_9FLAO|nr:OmpA family protein [Flaviramulus basaltis]SFZ91466.1 WD40-like Beta Propeller Repeat [Flaviramulus basaltis]
MKLKNYIITSIILIISFITSAQNGALKKADNLFNKFAFVNAAEAYHNLIDKNYNADYATRQLADSYAFMRNPDSAVIYYEKAVKQQHVPVEYYYNYAQALRGVKDYQAYRVWMKRFKNEGGKINDEAFLKDSDFINSIFNAKQQYFLNDVNFNSKYSDFGAYEHNGNIYFASSRDNGVSTKHVYGWNNEPFLDIYVTNKSANDTIVDHKSKLKGNINSVYHEGPLTITKDGKTMYFTRTNFTKNILGNDEEGITNLKIYKASLVEDKWKNIEELPFNGNDFSNGHPALNEDETKLYFASNKFGGYGGSDIYYVDINNDGSFGTPQNLGNVVNTDKNEKFPFVNSEGVLFFASDGHPGLGLLDIFGTVADKNNKIINVLNLGVPVNSSKDDFSFFMNSDGLSGYFASNRNGGIGSDDIYAYDRIPQLKVEGTATDIITNEPIQNAVVTLLSTDGNDIAFVETDENGYYEMIIDRDADYNLNIKKDNYIESSKPVTSKNIERHTKSIIADFELNEDVKKKEVIQIAEFYPIYFDFNKSDIRKDGTSELDRIVGLMVNKYPNMTIKIESYTDSRGPSEYNEKLSKERAIVAYKYLVDHGVNPERITEYKGFGEQNLVNKCDGTIRCTEKEHQQNRRTQFIVIKME